MALSQRLALFLLCAAALFTGGCSKAPNAEAAAPDVPTVAVAKVGVEDLSHNLDLTAEFKPYQEIELMAKIAGYIKEIRVDAGDRVQQGQLLALIEVPEMADDLRRAGASVERANAEIARAADELQRAQGAHEIAHLSFQRLSEVSQKRPGLIAQQEIDD